MALPDPLCQDQMMLSPPCYPLRFNVLVLAQFRYLELFLQHSLQMLSSQLSSSGVAVVTPSIYRIIHALHVWG